LRLCFWNKRTLQQSGNLAKLRDERSAGQFCTAALYRRCEKDFFAGLERLGLIGER